MRLLPASIRARILGVFALSLAALTGALGYGLVQLRAVGDGVATINAAWLPLASVSADLEAVERQMDRDLGRLGREGPRPLAGHRSSATLYSTQLADDIARGQRVVDEALRRIADPDEQAVLLGARDALGDIEARRLHFDTASSTFLEQGSSEEPGKSTAALADVERRRQELGLQIARFSALVEGRIQAVADRTARAQDRALAVSGTLAALALALGGAMAGVALFTLRPIDRLTAQVQRLAAGEAAGRVDVRSSDEIGVLAREFNAMAEAVAERDRRLNERAAALDRLSLRLRGVLDTIRAGLVVVESGADGPRVEMANPAAGRQWGSAEGQPLPADLAALLPPPDSPGSRRFEGLTLANRRYDVDVVPFGVRGALIVGEDVTERTLDRERLARSERLALVGQMLAQITHEVRNPLNAMSLNAELLADDIHEPEATAMLETITGEIRRLEAVTSRYLDLARRRQPELVDMDPMALVRDVLRVEEEALRRAGVVVSLQGDSPGLAELDGEVLRRALRNIVRNAVEAGARRLDIDVRREGDELIVSVRDDGPGMDAEHAERAFEPFFTTKAQGTGLGLAIGRQELEDVGGQLEAHTAPGQGAMFILSLPAIWDMEIDSSS